MAESKPRKFHLLFNYQFDVGEIKLCEYLKDIVSFILFLPCTGVMNNLVIIRIK